MGRTIAITAATVLFGFALAVSQVHANEDTLADNSVAELARPGIAPQMLALMDDQRL